ncbi:N-methylhydantoinase B [Paraburkholderia susongensis]|uniref:N-methylhydantoinase B n=2 Tax=Paraburkholderia susongensis TaxID=1515439 RepID=A0A1X7JEZ0_9BURK|nr:N-methylhydantoinase B [Paraburkholderia susongensis]
MTMKQTQTNPSERTSGAYRTDKVFIEILNNRLNGITSEMGHIIHRASFTPFIKEAWDFGEALVSKQGEIFSYPRDIGVAFMCGAMMEDIIAAFDNYEPGDIVIANDPSSTGGLCTHLPDIHLLKPYFYAGELICFSWTFIHSSDVGGMVPGSIALAANDLFQEGIRIPATKLYNKGKLNEDLMRTFLANCRIPYHNEGDIQAMVSAMRAAEKRLDDTIVKYGLQRFVDGMADLLDYGEDRSRDVLSGVPDGRYEMVDYLELDGTNLPPARLKLAMEVSGSSVHLDFTGTDPQVGVALNLPTRGKNHHFVNAGIFNFVYAVDNSIPINRGIVRPVSVTLPEGSLVNPEPTAAVGVRFATVVRIMEMIFGVLSQAVDGAQPASARVAGKVPAAGAGMLGVTLVSLNDPETGELKVNVVQPLWGGSGARPVKDGIDGADFAAGYLRNIPVETTEVDLPITVYRYCLSTTPPSKGKWRGGVGIEMEFAMRCPEATLTARGMERFHFRPWGRKGGAPGSLGSTTLNPGNAGERNIGKITNSLLLEQGEVVRIVTPNGAGYGNPFERDPHAVLRDVMDGFIDAKTARDDYGVLIKDKEVDVAATQRLRSDQNNASLSAFSFGSERDAFERGFPPEVQDRVLALVQQFPVSGRHRWKGQLWRKWSEGAEAGTPVDLAAALPARGR